VYGGGGLKGLLARERLQEVAHVSNQEGQQQEPEAGDDEDENDFGDPRGRDLVACDGAQLLQRKTQAGHRAHEKVCAVDKLPALCRSKWGPSLDPLV